MTNQLRMTSSITVKLPEYFEAFRDVKTGIFYIKNGRIGIEHCCHANIDGTGSVRGMKKLGYWKRKDRCIRSHGAVYNIDTLVIHDCIDQIAADYCMCVACRERKERGSEWYEKQSQEQKTNEILERGYF